MNNDVLPGLRDQWQSQIKQKGLLRMSADQGAAGTAGHSYQVLIGALGEHGARADSRRESSRPLSLDEVLPRHYFLRQLQRETRRTDRTAAPLSIALFRFADIERDQTNGIEGLLETINGAKREADVIGSLSAHSIAILLPDTDQEGAKALAERIVKRVNIPPVSTVTVSYPDRLFTTLIEENADVSGLALHFGDHLPAAKQRAHSLKRALDIIISIVALLLLWPVMLVTAIAVALSSPGPVIFRQVRLGRRGIPFVFYKFRTMFSDADDRIHRDYVANLIKGNLDQINQGTATKPFYKIKSDPRVTRVGKFIRSTNIDELPQLFNVLKGEMSLVGPRPPLPYEVEKYKSWHLRRLLEVRPGITGLWQVDGHNTTTFDDMVRIDLRYIRNCSLFLDLSILFRTVKLFLERLWLTAIQN